MIRMRIVFIGLFALSVIAEIYIAHQPKFAFDDRFGFYAWVGLGACAAFVLIAWLMSALLSRPDSYYDG